MDGRGARRIRVVDDRAPDGAPDQHEPEKRDKGGESGCFESVRAEKVEEGHVVCPRLHGCFKKDVLQRCKMKDGGSRLKTDAALFPSCAEPAENDNQQHRQSDAADQRIACCESSNRDDDSGNPKTVKSCAFNDYLPFLRWSSTPSFSMKRAIFPGFAPDLA